MAKEIEKLLDEAKHISRDSEKINLGPQYKKAVEARFFSFLIEAEDETERWKDNFNESSQGEQQALLKEMDKVELLEKEMVALTQKLGKVGIVAPKNEKPKPDIEARKVAARKAGLVPLPPERDAKAAAAQPQAGAASAQAALRPHAKAAAAHPHAGAGARQPLYRVRGAAKEQLHQFGSQQPAVKAGHGEEERRPLPKAPKEGKPLPNPEKYRQAHPESDDPKKGVQAPGGPEVPPSRRGSKH